MAQIVEGSYLGRTVVFPDYTHTQIESWGNELIASLPTASVQGFVLRDNWPDNSKYQFTDDRNNFPYISQVATLFTRYFNCKSNLNSFWKINR